MIEIYLKMASILGIEIREKKITCFSCLPKEAKVKAKNFLEKEGLYGAPIVFVNINAGELTLLRRLPLDKMTRILSQTVAKKPDIHLVFIGSPSEQAFVKKYIKSLPSPVLERAQNIAGKTNISELLSLFFLGHAYLGNDSGPLHLAVAMGLPAVAFFGPETPNLYGYNFSPHQMHYSNHHCSPCLNSLNFKMSRCKRTVCLENIQEEPVAESVVNILNQKKPEELVIP